MPTWEYDYLFVERNNESSAYVYSWYDNWGRYYEQTLDRKLTELGEQRWELVDLVPQEWENDFAPTGGVRLSRVLKYMAVLKRQTGP